MKKSMSTKIQHTSIPTNKRILVVSDVHAHLDYLKGVLDKASFSDDDILFIVGDMVEKGPDSLGTLRYVMELCKQKNVVPLVGNVDAHRLTFFCELSEETAPELYEYIVSARKWYGSSFYEELAAECGYAINSPKDILLSKQDVIAHFESEFSFLSELPTIVETQNYIFVHGGLCERNVSDNQCKGVFELTKYDAFMDKTPHIFDKYVIVGHWPVPLYNSSVQQLNPIINREKRIISIDGGCGIKKECQLNLLIIPDISCPVDEISYISYDSIPTVIALDDQMASVDPIHISWVNRKINVIERGKEFSYVEHIYSGRKLYVPSSYLKSDTECSDYTDYVLPVKRGDKLSLITKTSRGCIVKKNGVVGWYLGNYQA